MSRWSVTVALVIALMAIAACSHGTTTSKPSRVPSLPAVDTKATPPGWVPVDYGDAQLSVAPGWNVQTVGGCMSPIVLGTILLQQPGNPTIAPDRTPRACFPTKTAASVVSSFVEVGRIATSPAPGVRPLVIHGIVVHIGGETGCALSGQCLTLYVVPSLGVEILDDETGDLRGTVIDTLTHSPRAVALAPGSVVPVPARWHRVSFGGISVAVPGSWSVQTTSNWFLGCVPFDLAMYEQAVTLNRGATSIAPSCVAEVGGYPARKPTDGLVIDPGRYGPLSSSTTFARCLKVNDLSVCPTTSDLYGVLVAAVHIPGHTRPVAIEIGLAGGGWTARTIPSFPGGELMTDRAYLTEILDCHSIPPPP